MNKKIILILLTIFSLNAFCYYSNTNSQEFDIAKDLFRECLKNSEKGDYKRAITEYIKAIEIDETIPSKNENGLLNKSIAYLKNELIKDPLDLELRYLLGRALEAKGEFKRALLEYKKLIRNFPKTKYASLSWKQVNRYIFLKTLH